MSTVNPWAAALSPARRLFTSALLSLLSTFAFVVAVISVVLPFVVEVTNCAMAGFREYAPVVYRVVSCCPVRVGAPGVAGMWVKLITPVT